MRRGRRLSRMLRAPTVARLAALLLVWPAPARAGGGPAPTAEQTRAGFVVFRRSVLERVQPESRPEDDVVTAVRLRWIAAYKKFTSTDVGAGRDARVSSVRRFRCSMARLRMFSKRSASQPSCGRGS